MSEKDFESIVQKIADERGKDIFLEPGKLRPLLKDYAKDEFKRETALLSAILETDCVEFINRAEDLNECKQFLVNRLEDDHSISPKKSAGMLDILIFVLRGQRLSSLAAEGGDEWTPEPEVNREAEAAYDRGVEYLQSANYDKAIKEFTEAVRLDPNYAFAYHFRGMSYFALEQYEPAIEDFTDAIRLDLNDVNTYFLLGKAYHEKGLYDLAIEGYTDAIRLEPNNAGFYYHRGVTYSFSGQYEPAIKDFTEAIRLGSKHGNVKDLLEIVKVKQEAWEAYNRSSEYLRIEDYDKALKEIDEALRLAPNNSDYISMRRIIYEFKTGERELVTMEQMQTILKEQMLQSLKEVPSPVTESDEDHRRVK